MRWPYALAAVASALVVAAEASPRVGIQCEKTGGTWEVITGQCVCSPCHLCEFKFFQWECQQKRFDGMDESDGSKEPVDQPELKAKAWFLDENEMTESRHGIKRDGLALWTDKNTVKTYAATKEFFDDVYADFKAVKKHEHVWMTGWSFDDVTLKPEAPAKQFNDTKLLAMLQGMAKKGVDFHVLGWTNPLEWKQNIALQEKVNAIQPPPPQGKAYFLFDDRLPDATASHHQKTIAIKRAQGIVAYVGGTDLTWNRWDTLAHDTSELRKQTEIERDDTHGWMEGHVKIDGPAAIDVATNFVQRWNAKTRPLKDFFDPLLPFENPEYSDLADVAALAHDDILVVQETGDHAVQIVRTYSCQADNHYQSFAPSGERSIYHSRLKALKMAKNYVYIEDQYFIYVLEFLDVLLAILPRLQRLIIVTQPASTATSLTGYRKYQYEMLTPLQEKFPNKVQIYQTKPDRAIYVHSKFLIIDDVFLSVGSANWNRRSMTADSEMAANVVDSEIIKSPDGIQVNKLARDYRIHKFMELTGRSYKELDKMTLLEAANLLDTAAEEEDTILARYQVEEDPSFFVFTDGVQDVLDPLEECPSTE